MTDTNLRVLDGGRTLDVRTSNHHFISAYVTDTRLMGVLAVYAHWHIDNYPEEAKGNGESVAKGNADSDANIVWGDLHQFFYIDCEETGIETYQSIRETNDDMVEEIEQKLIGGLGASKVDLNEGQLRSLMCTWRRFNEDHQLPLPEGRNEYDFIFDDSRELPDLMEHICPIIKTDYQLINYFLMRCFGRDYSGARFLCAGSGTDNCSVPVDLYGKYTRATFWRNTIDRRSESADGCTEYLCESIVEEGGNYDLIVSRVIVRDLRIVSLECRSITPLTNIEATITMRKNEFVSRYDILLTDDELEENMDEFSIGFHATESETENGRLFMSYKPNNDHVDRRIFQLNDDVRGLFFVTNNGELIVAAYDEPDIDALERSLSANVLAPHLRLRARYEFKNPILYGFMHSDFDFFDEYLRIITGGDGIDR